MTHEVKIIGREGEMVDGDHVTNVFRVQAHDSSSGLSGYAQAGTEDEATDLAIAELDYLLAEKDRFEELARIRAENQEPVEITKGELAAMEQRVQQMEELLAKKELVEKRKR
jgi:hypothetical protein